MRFSSDLRQFKQLGGQVSQLYPILSEFSESAGKASGHYFHQDLLVASMVSDRQPRRHIDVGSRIDGFVAHVASFREIEVLDIRPIIIQSHPQILFSKLDLTVGEGEHNEIADSISCLHAIEHFGLGRYGDPIDPEGHLKGFQNLVKMLEPKGDLYVSFPIGLGNSVVFNAHRVFHPTDILTWPTGGASLSLKSFSYVDDAGDLHRDAELGDSFPRAAFGCGIYHFQKN